MTQGIFVRDTNTDRLRRPKSKKEVREIIEADPSRVYAEATSFHGGEYDGPMDDAPLGKVVFVGPDPEVKRNFYGTITRTNSGFKVT